MKQAVVKTGGKQYLVKEGQILDIELVTQSKQLTFEPLLVFDDNPAAAGAQVGQPVVNGVKVTAEVIEAEIKSPKIRVVHYKAKKRVHKLAGHRQRYTRIKISSIGK
ncbi:50S ribosomal protein L21 [Candidatus Microgenomates bacterium]|nr:50S ribosomal protein L21 [Candidatus Microgenomates bacterium]